MPNPAQPPATPAFVPLSLTGNGNWTALGATGASERLATAAAAAPRGQCVFYGIPFEIGETPFMLREGDASVSLPLGGITAEWLLLAHTSDYREDGWAADPLVTSNPAINYHGEMAASYTFIHADGTETAAEIRLGDQIGLPQSGWGINCTEARPHDGCRPMDNQGWSDVNWGWAQFRVSPDLATPYTHWLWAWRNPHPDSPLRELRLQPRRGCVIIAGITAGNASDHPLRWQSRQKVLLRLPRPLAAPPVFDREGVLAEIRLDMGQVISAVPRPLYPAVPDWPQTPENQPPELSQDELIVEYTAHADAAFHLADGSRIPLASLAREASPLRVIPPATQRVRLRVVERRGGRPVACRLHVHGEAGEYLPPMDRHRMPNGAFNEDYSADYLHDGRHFCAYIPGETELKLPPGPVCIEITKGFELRPLRRCLDINAETHDITIELDRVLPWSDRGWRSADTHVHFVSPQTGLLEGAGEGVHVVNLLASQWGELLTNVGDFDGRTTHASDDGSGRYLLRVGTENRQHLLGHISLVGYDGPPILPLCVGGPSESAFGESVSVLITEWARQCRAQNGLAVMPHWPRPRLENAATLVAGEADAVEFCSWDRFYDGIDPYSLADWYRFLNNGYLTPAVGGTDKMCARTAVGTLRSYARIAGGDAFTYENWKRAIRRGETFVTCGPLLEMQVDGHPMGSRIAMGSSGGTVTVTWEAASVTVPMTRVELLANGEIIDGASIDGEQAAGTFTVRVERSTWLALLVRGHFPDHPEIIAAHTTPVMIDVAGSPFAAAADAMSILRQIEGAIAWLDSLATPPEADRLRQMRLRLTTIHRDLHNRMHARGIWHDHTPATDHPEHH